MRFFFAFAALVGVAFAVAAAPAAEAPPGTAPLVRDAAADTLRARSGDRLVLQDFRGRLRVRAVAGDLVRLVHVSPPSGGASLLSRSGDRIRITGRGPEGRSPERELVVDVPAWLAVELRGHELEAAVEGLRADVSVRNVEGDLEVRDVVGAVSLWSVDGEIRVTDVRGAVAARSVDESVELTRVTGDVDVGSTDGDVRLWEVDASEVDAQTVDGDITFEGSLRAGGTYALVTHGGDVTATIPEDAGVRIEVSTFDGSFEAAFPVRLERFRGGREMSFVLGDGRARLVLQAFGGDIRLRHRP